MICLEKVELVRYSGKNCAGILLIHFCIFHGVGHRELETLLYHGMIKSMMCMEFETNFPVGLCLSTGHSL